ncbi:PREDICTED: myosin ID heavy chain-like [Ipomoea nil]|uniref:myosin ID heavy chain-like n=1 Tax=Ipomoea nil TaxID=35883 RepID=UPI0009019671|nr:PREDICTED: myosin ID heavy chain-like [Ipomoea nil]
MSRYRPNLAVRVEPDEAEDLRYDDEETAAENNEEEESRGVDCPGDHVGVPSRPYLMKILQKQGDTNLVFADKVLRFTSSGKMKRRILLITDFAIYIVDPETDVLKRRIALAAVEKLCLSKLSDNFFAIIIPTEYDILMASTRKTEIVMCIADTTRSVSNYELDVFHSNRFEYNATAELVKQIKFEEVEGGVKTRIVQNNTQRKE